MKSELSEIRQDPVSKDWLIIATGRSRRPDEFRAKTKKKETAAADCQFCRADAFDNPEASGNVVVSQNEWVTVIENKYPLVAGDKCGLIVEKGPYEVQPGAGKHEVIITRDHNRSLGQMSQEEAEQVVAAYLERYRALVQHNCSRYILIFHNHGEEAGASISHPHSQTIAIPVIPGDVEHSLIGSREYHEKKGGCIHCEMIRWERSEKKRIVFENSEMIVVSPFVPRTAFELRIYPKGHSAYFEDMDEAKKKALAEALKEALGRLYAGLDDIAYNFFVHTAPVFERDRYSYYHWHIEILPKAPTPPAGFELGTDIDVSPINPDEAAEYLRGVKI